MSQKTISWLKNQLSVTKERVEKSELNKIVPYNELHRKILLDQKGENINVSKRKNKTYTEATRGSRK